MFYEIQTARSQPPSKKAFFPSINIYLPKLLSLCNTHLNDYKNSIRRSKENAEYKSTTEDNILKWQF